MSDVIDTFSSHNLTLVILRRAMTVFIDRNGYVQNVGKNAQMLGKCRLVLIEF